MVDYVGEQSPTTPPGEYVIEVDDSIISTIQKTVQVQVETGTVDEFTVDGEQQVPQYTTQDQIVLLSESPTYFTIDDFANIPYVIVGSLDWVKQNQIAAMYADYQADIVNGFSSSATGTSLQYAYDVTDQAWFNKASILDAAGLMKYPIQWRLADNTYVTIPDSTTFKKLELDAATFEQVDLAKYRNARDAINAATDEDTVNNVTWK